MIIDRKGLNWIALKYKKTKLNQNFKYSDQIENNHCHVTITLIHDITMWHDHEKVTQMF